MLFRLYSIVFGIQIVKFWACMSSAILNPKRGCFTGSIFFLLTFRGNIFLGRLKSGFTTSIPKGLFHRFLKLVVNLCCYLWNTGVDFSIAIVGRFVVRRSFSQLFVAQKLGIGERRHLIELSLWMSLNEKRMRNRPQVVKPLLSRPQKNISPQSQ